VIYGGYPFELDEKQRSQVKIIARDCDSTIANQLELEMSGFREYSKWISKTEIQDVIEKRLPIEEFVMPETTAKDN
jgi:hypothetical protein